MNRVARRVALLLALAPIAGAAHAGDDADLDLIPAGVSGAASAPAPAAAPAPTARAWKINLENATAATAIRNQSAAPVPGADPSRIENRSSLDARGKLGVSDAVSLNLSNRLSLDTGDGSTGTHPRNDAREGYLDWSPSSDVHVEIGRINIKSGTAMGSNPTDWFKEGAKVQLSSADPQAMRENRLGTVMLRSSVVWDGGSASLAYAPKLADAPDLTRRVGDWNLGLDRTNHDDRVVGVVGFDVGDLTLRGSAMWRRSGSRLGFDASRNLSDTVVGWVEWSGGWGLSTIDAGEEWGRKTGLVPAAAPDVLDPGARTRFLNDLSVGFSWALETKVTISLEYQFHQGGMGASEWNRWFDRAASGDPRTLGALWSIRSLADFEGEAATRHRGFARVSWSDAFVRKLELSGFTSFNPTDGSGLAQVEANYPLSDTWSAIATVSTTYGGRRTEFGSLGDAFGGVLRIVRYF